MYLDNQMHDLKVERFYKPRTINDQWIHAEGPIKTFTLRGLRTRRHICTTGAS